MHALSTAPQEPPRQPMENLVSAPTDSVTIPAQTLVFLAEMTRSIWSSTTCVGMCASSPEPLQEPREPLGKTMSAIANL